MVKERNLEKYGKYFILMIILFKKYYNYKYSKFLLLSTLCTFDSIFELTMFLFHGIIHLTHQRLSTNLTRKTRYVCGLGPRGNSVFTDCQYTDTPTRVYDASLLSHVPKRESNNLFDPQMYGFLASTRKKSHRVDTIKIYQKFSKIAQLSNNLIVTRILTLKFYFECSEINNFFSANANDYTSETIIIARSICSLSTSKTFHFHWPGIFFRCPYCSRKESASWSHNAKLRLNLGSGLKLPVCNPGTTWKYELVKLLSNRPETSDHVGV